MTVFVILPFLQWMQKPCYEKVFYRPSSRQLEISYFYAMTWLLGCIHSHVGNISFVCWLIYSATRIPFCAVIFDVHFHIIDVHICSMQFIYVHLFSTNTDLEDGLLMFTCRRTVCIQNGVKSAFCDYLGISVNSKIWKLKFSSQEDFIVD